MTARFAYAFYATSDRYALAAMVAARLLRTLGRRDDVDLVVLHLNVSPYLVSAMEAMGLIPRRVEALPPVGLPHYRHCLVKLRAMRLVEYERIVFLDSDSLPLRSLDDAFDLPLSRGLAAPPAYWLPQPWFTSALLVVAPSRTMWDRVSRHFDRARANGYCDMDILNVELGAEIDPLPADFFALNSEWEDAGRASYFGDPGEAFERIRLVHFSALGKPWQYRPDQARALRPAAHPAFHSLWDRWWSERERIGRGSGPLTRLRLARLARKGLRLR